MLKFKMRFRDLSTDDKWKDGGIREMSKEGVKRDYGYIPKIGDTLKDCCVHAYEEMDYTRIK